MSFHKWTLLLCSIFYLSICIGQINAQGCGGNYTANYGVFTSPNYPSVYGTNSQCIYTISTATSSSITLSFETFELDRSSGDYVSITCASNSSFLQQTYTWNNNIPPISIPWCNSGQLNFSSDSSSPYSTRGFRVQYQVNTKGCGNTVFNSSSGIISSPNHPSSYNANENCTYSIWASGSSSFTLSFQAFNLQTSSDCRYDWIQIWCDNTSYILPKYCGSTLPKPAYISNCQKVMIWFHTDGSGQYSGFKLQYSRTLDGCGKSTYDGLSGIITSPNYPKGYSGVDCDYNLYLVSSVGLAFQSFDLEPFIDMSHGDFVEIHCVPNSGSHYCRGNTLPPLISYTSCKHVQIHFNTNEVLSGTGFSLKYQTNPLVSYSTITNTPKNIATNVGIQVQLDCTSNATNYYPSWTLSRDGTDENTTVIASFCDVWPEYNSQYSVLKGGTGVCNLVIKSATLAQAGVYTCIDVGLASFSSIVAVIDKDYTFSARSPVVKGDLLTFTHSIKFNGSVAPAPVLPMIYYWDITGRSVAISNTTLPNIIVSSINVTAEPGIVPSYGFTLTFAAPAYRAGYATNAPTFKSYLTTGYIVVQYWPEEKNMTITGHCDEYIAYNGVLHCNVSSDPPSSFRWLDHTDGTYTSGSSIVVTQSGTYTCNASNVIKGKTYSASKSITVQVLNTNASSDESTTAATASTGQVPTTTSAPSGQGCGGNYTAEYGVFMSPNYPNAYTLNVECIYRIIPSTMSSITLSFETFELDRSSGDYVVITCESDTGFVPKNYTWSSNIPPISLPSCSIGQLYFRSDSSHSYPTRGFSVQYQVSTESCDNTVFTSSSGTISSPNYPQNYNNDENCTFSIWAPEISSFTLNFQAFDLESDCRYDWVQIWCENSGYILSKYCDSTLPKPAHISNCKKVLIWFHTDSSAAFSGFSLQYSVTPNGCGKERYGGLTGIMTSPNYPGEYDGMECYYYLHPVSSVTLDFQSFDLEPFDGEYGDYLQIDAYYKNTSSIYLTYRGNTLPPLISCPLCDTVRLRFNANWAISGTGYNFRYQANPLVAHTEILTAPKNFTVDVGTRVQLDCTSDAKDYLPSWTLSTDGKDENTATVASFCDLNPYFPGEYVTETDGPGVCNLVILAATQAEAGIYTCIDVGLSSIVSVVTVVDAKDGRKATP